MGNVLGSNFWQTWYGNLIKILGSIAALAVVGIKGIDHVDQGQRALKRRFGKVVIHKRGLLKGQPKEISPGLRILIPFVHSLWKTSIQQRQKELRIQTRSELNGTYFGMSAMITFTVTDIYLDLTVALDTDGQIVTLCEKHLNRLYIGNSEPLDSIPYALVQDAAAEAAWYGVVLNELSIVAIAPTVSSQMAWAWHAARNSAPDLSAVAMLAGPISIDRLDAA